jgi:hypothetical protein
MEEAPMHLSPRLTRFTLALATAVLCAAPAGATTLMRAGLDELVRMNETIVQGKVVDIHSYWNADHSFILTDVRVRPNEYFKGAGRPTEDLTFTLPGGTVGETSVILIGMPELAPGSEYLLFLNREDLPGAEARLTVRDLVQGAFEVATVHGQKRVFSQAIGTPLVADRDGLTGVIGGRDGLDIGDMTRQIKNLLGER